MKVGPLFATIVCCDISLFTDMSCALVTSGSVVGRKLTSNKIVPDADSYMTYYTCVLSLFVYEHIFISTFVLCFVDMAASMALPDVAEVPGLFPLLCEATKIRVRIVDMHDGA